MSGDEEGNVDVMKALMQAGKLYRVDADVKCNAE